jgi:hypothetical protein
LESNLYDANRFLQELPASGWSSEKALVLSRLGQHEAVLRIYVHELRDVEAAEQYCERIYSEAQAHKAGGVGGGGGGGGLGGKSHHHHDDDDDADDVSKIRNRKSRVRSLASSHKLPDKSDEENARLNAAASDVYLDLIKVYLSDELGSPDLNAVVKVLNKHFNRVHPVKVLAVVPPSTPLVLLAPFLSKAMRHLDSQRRGTQVQHGLLKVHFMNLSHEVTQKRIEQLSDMAQVPALAKLGSPKHSYPPVLLSESDYPSEHEVKCIRHQFESGHMVLQFEVKNALKGNNNPNMSHVLVRVVASDDDLYTVEKEIELPFLPFASMGSCYVVLREKRQTMGGVITSFSCDLYYDEHVIPLQNIEVNTHH